MTFAVRLVRVPAFMLRDLAPMKDPRFRGVVTLGWPGGEVHGAGLVLAPSADPDVVWWELQLGQRAATTRTELRSQWAHLCLRFHPDAGGTDEQMARVNRAYDLLKQRTKEAA
jgi:hypothetical protein